jgi:hypothetical protein
MRHRTVFGRRKNSWLEKEYCSLPGVVGLTAVALPDGKLQMLFAAKKVAARGDGFAGGEMDAADSATNHIFRFGRGVRRAAAGGSRFPRRRSLACDISQQQVNHDEYGDDEEEFCHANLARRWTLEWSG